MAKSERLGLEIHAVDKASPAFKSAAASMKSFAGNTKILNSTLGKLAGGAGLAGLALGAVKMADAFARGAAQTQMLRTSMDNLASGFGENSAEMLEALDRAASGTIANRELIAAANRSMLLGVSHTTEEMVKLMEVARVRGAAMGLSTKQAFDDIVTGIGRVSPWILDNLGIVTGGMEAFETYARSIGKTSKELTPLEKRQFLLNKVLAETAPLLAAAVGEAEPLARKYERLTSSLQDLQDALGAWVAPTAGGFADWLSEQNVLMEEALKGETLERSFKPAREAAEEAAKAFEHLQTSLQPMTELLAELQRNTAITEVEAGVLAETYGVALPAGILYSRDAIVSYLQAQLAAYDANLENARIVKEGTTAIWAYGDGVQGAGQKIGFYNDQAAFAEEATNKVTNAVTKLRAALEDVGPQFQKIGDEARSALEGAALSTVGTIGSGAALELLDDANAVLNEVILNTASLPDLEKKFALAEVTAGFHEWTAELTKAPKKIKESTKAIDDLRSKVQGLISEAMNVTDDLGLDLDDFMPREDAVNENARRLADIMVNGLKGQDWLDEFKKEVPDIYAVLAEAGDPKAAAARMLKAFQEGRLPGLIDRAEAKARIMRMLFGEAAMGDLAEELTNEIYAEVGDKFSREDIAAAATGVTSGSMAAGAKTGMKFSEAFAQQASSEGQTQEIAKNMETNFKKVTPAIQRTGYQMGSMWGIGFLQSVGDAIPIALIKILVRLVTPGVMAGLATQAAAAGTVDGDPVPY